MNILIIEDDITSGKVLSRMLVKYGSTSIATNGRDGLNLFKNTIEKDALFSLIFLDIMLPEMDGQEVLKEIRRIEKDRDVLGFDSVKIVMTTALDDSKNVMQAFRSQCEGYLVKPILQAKLQQEISRLFEDSNY
jgi:two-component system, chemotaxis family, chemotaxis protein CheY